MQLLWKKNGLDIQYMRFLINLRDNFDVCNMF